MHFFRDISPPFTVEIDESVGALSTFIFDEVNAFLGLCIAYTTYIFPTFCRGHMSRLVQHDNLIEFEAVPNVDHGIRSWIAKNAWTHFPVETHDLPHFPLFSLTPGRFFANGRASTIWFINVKTGVTRCASMWRKEVVIDDQKPQEACQNSEFNIAKSEVIWTDALTNDVFKALFPVASPFEVGVFWLYTSRLSPSMNKRGSILIQRATVGIYILAVTYTPILPVDTLAVLQTDTASLCCPLTRSHFPG